ncbi:hypothetical protein FOC1_g10010717 [Fusarium oxysporum f. sp. cubense race 1]|uniref:Uncharacterized protein n=1 Tax=Fusarium oxysporum f. sp. cubense (strain race 1) TaxID=1229664 RepID=N4U7Q9_FUSC1|nr:hypothetical protein FOC1_g10010717 [Fusarium oxysporum f. sp. cubense race 1]
MPSPQKHPISYTKSDSEQDEWPILSTNDHELLPSGEAHEVQSSDPARNGTEPSKAVRQFTGFASIKRKSDRFWEAWNVYVNRPWNMYVLVIIGTLFAPMMLRYGTVIAFFAKASLGTAVTISFHQRAWRVVRFKTARVETIDSIFTANTDFSSLLTWSSIRKAKIGTLLALYCWVTPLVVILTSETLSVVVGVFEEDHACTSVRTLNFENEEKVYWRNPQKIDDQYLVSVSLWNSTLDYGESPSDSKAEGFDYYHSSSKKFDMLIATKTTLMGEAIVRKESAAEICGEGWNCSYVVNFVAPGYKCQELASGVGSEVKKLGNATAPFNTSVIAPMGNRTYYAVNDRGEYGDPQMSSHAGGKPKQNPPYPDNFGAFRTEPIMWIGYATVDDLSVPQPDTPGTEAWKKAYTPVLIGCEHYEVNYTAQFNYTGGAQFVEIKRREYLRKVVDTTYVPEKDPDMRLKASRASSLYAVGARQGGGVKIGYGLVHDEAGRSVRSFGVEGNVQQ